MFIRRSHFSTIAFCSARGGRGNNVFKSYNELLSILNEDNVYEYESKEYGKFKFELENNEIKVIFVE